MQLSHKQNILLSLFSVLLIITFLFGANAGLENEKAQDFELVDINGKSFSLSDYKGKVVLLDFFSTRCGPCIMEIEQLQTLYKEYSSEQLVILSISVSERDSLQTLQLFAQQNQTQWTVALDTDNVGDKYNVSRIPHLVVVDTEGYERYSHIEITEESTLRSEIDVLIAEKVQIEADRTLLAVVGCCGIALFVIGIIAVKKRKKSQNALKNGADASGVNFESDSTRSESV